MKMRSTTPPIHQKCVICPGRRGGLDQKESLREAVVHGALDEKRLMERANIEVRDDHGGVDGDGDGRGRPVTRRRVWNGAGAVADVELIETDPRVLRSSLEALHSSGGALVSGQHDAAENDSGGGGGEDVDKNNEKNNGGGFTGLDLRDNILDGADVAVLVVTPRLAPVNVDLSDNVRLVRPARRLCARCCHLRTPPRVARRFTPFAHEHELRCGGLRLLARPSISSHTTRITLAAVTGDTAPSPWRGVRQNVCLQA